MGLAYIPVLRNRTATSTTQLCLPMLTVMPDVTLVTQAWVEKHTLIGLFALKIFPHPNVFKKQYKNTLKKINKFCLKVLQFGPSACHVLLCCYGQALQSTC